MKNTEKKVDKNVHKKVIWRMTYVILMSLLSIELILLSTSVKTTMATNNLSNKVNIDTDGDGFADNVDLNKYEWNVGPRDLAIFASLAYEDINENSMIRSNQYIGIKKGDSRYNEYLDCMHSNETDGKYCFINENLNGFDGIKLSSRKTIYKENGPGYIFYNFANASEVSKWDIVDYYSKSTAVLSKENAKFTAMTFKNGNNIVIAYRGTDFDDILEWMQDILGYGVIGYQGQEEFAENYALRIADIYSDSKYKIYITGHSLGGYLAQIGAAKLIEENKAENLQQVVYFNGMGLKFNNKLPAKTQDAAANSLKKCDSEGIELISYSTGGDPVSAMGTHYGKKIVLPASPIAIEHHKGQMENIQRDLLGTDLTSSAYGRRLSVILSLLEKTSFIKNDNEIGKYYKKYGFTSLLDFMWTAHETDSFLYNLDQGNRSWKNYVSDDVAPTCKITLSDSKVKFNKTITATLECFDDNELKNPNLSFNNIKVETVINRVKITKISGPQLTKVNNGYKYTWQITLKGLVVGNTSISVYKNTFSDIAGNCNAKVVSGPIKVTLR